MNYKKVNSVVPSATPRSLSTMSLYPAGFQLLQDHCPLCPYILQDSSYSKITVNYVPISCRIPATPRSLSTMSLYPAGLQLLQDQCQLCPYILQDSSYSKITVHSVPLSYRIPINIDSSSFSISWSYFGQKHL